jgi:peroxiredoxin
MAIGLALALAAPLVGAARADGWRHMDGEPCPPIQAESWLNAGDVVPSLETLQGSPFLLVFFATWERACMTKVGMLSDLHAKYAPLGFRVVVVSGEGTRALQKELVDGRKAAFWIGSDPRGETIKLFSDGEILIPHVYLVGADGTVLGEDLPTDGRVRSLLWSGFDRALRDLRPELAKAAAAYAAQSYGVAWKEAGKLADDDDEAVAADARYLRERIEALGTFWKGFLEVDLAGTSFLGVHADLVIFAHRFDGLAVAEWADGVRAEMAKSSDVDREKAAWKAFDKAVKSEVDAAGDARRLRRAQDLYEKLAKDHPRTFPGRLAKQAVERLAADG